MVINRIFDDIIYGKNIANMFLGYGSNYLLTLWCLTLFLQPLLAPIKSNNFLWHLMVNGSTLTPIVNLYKYAAISESDLKELHLAMSFCFSTFTSFWNTNEILIADSFSFWLRIKYLYRFFYQFDCHYKFLYDILV